MATFEQALFHLWPSGDTHIPGLRAAIVASAPRVFETYGLNTKTAVLQFMAQISHECGAGLEVEENLSYSAQRMTEVWPSRFHNVTEALPYAHNPRELGNKVYNGRMGNAIGSNDGYNFRGRGATQTTGRTGYNLLGNKLRLDLLGQPELVNSPQNFLECGAADFQICGCVLPALSNDIIKVTEKLNGGTIGLSERIQWHSKWEAMDITIPAWSTPSKPKPPVVQSPASANASARQATNIVTAFLDGLKSLFKRG
jgi:putative chitinase